MARLVPQEVVGDRATSTNGIVLEAVEETSGGCGRTATQTNTGDMARMEQQLNANEEALDRETEVKMPKVGLLRLEGANNHRKAPKQQLRRCIRCNYLSSQALCQACSLLEGLNKNRPRVEVASPT